MCHRFLCRPRHPFFLRRKKGRKERRQNQGFAILPRLRCRLRRSSLPRESGFAKFVPCFRMVSASPSATRSALVLAGLPGEICAPTVRQREGTPPYGYLGGWCVQADVGIGPYKGTPCRAGPMCPAAHCTPCCVSLRGRCAHRLWRSAPPYLRRAEGSPPYGVLSENRP